MLLINVHELDVVLAQPVVLCTLEDKVDDVRRIFSFECEDVLILRASQDLLQRCEVDAECDVAVTAER